MDNDMELKAWPFFGYAPGGYLCHCGACKLEFEGDKRAVRCIECAVREATAALNTRPPAPGSVGARETEAPHDLPPDRLDQLAFVVFYSPVLCAPQNIEAVIKEIDCHPCDHVSNGGICYKSDRGDYCPGDVVNTLHDISAALYGTKPPASWRPRRILSALEPDPARDRALEEAAQVAEANSFWQNYDEGVWQRKTIAAAIRALRSAPAPEDGWRDIKTAPRNGTRIDLWDGMERIPDCFWHEGVWHQLSEGVLDEPPPTHWRPLPAAPNPPSQGGE